MSSHVTNLHVSQPTLQQLITVLGKDFTLLKMGKQDTNMDELTQEAPEFAPWKLMSRTARSDVGGQYSQKSALTTNSIISI